MTLREAANMSLINDRLIPRHSTRARLALPVEIRVDHDALRHKRCAVALIEAQVVAFGPDRVTETLRPPLQLTDTGPRIRVQQQLVGIEAMASLRLIGSVNTEPING
jgi:hypothetical protein